MPEIEEEYLVKTGMILPKNPLAKDKEEVKQEENYSPSTKPTTNFKEEPIQIPVDTFANDLTAL